MNGKVKKRELREQNRYWQILRKHSRYQGYHDIFNDQGVSVSERRAKKVSVCATEHKK